MGSFLIMRFRDLTYVNEFAEAVLILKPLGPLCDRPNIALLLWNVSKVHMHGQNA